MARPKIQERTPDLLRVEPFLGLNVSQAAEQINDHQSPDLLNVIVSKTGNLDKRTGYKKAFTTSLGSGRITGMYLYRKIDDTKVFLFGWDTKLYKLENGAPVLLSSTFSGNELSFFVMNNKCYIQDGTKMQVTDGVTVSDIVPYIPTVSISKTPLGGGTPFEDFNLLGGGFKDSFSGDGTAKDYQLSFSGIDADKVTATVDGANKVEGTDFTVNRTSGKVTFTTAPTKGTNNVIITGYKRRQDLERKIHKCRINVLYGGANDTRVFVAGNVDLLNVMYGSGVNDPTYFPENRFYQVGADSEYIMNFAKQFDTLVIIKERSIWGMSFELKDGVPSYPTKPLNDTTGAVSRNSVQVLDNTPVMFNDKGVFSLTSSNVRDERNVSLISEDINPALLVEANKQNAKTIDYDRKYFLALNNRVYVYDYDIKSWYQFDNINACNFLEVDGRLYFGALDKGMIYMFMKPTDTYPYNDDGKAINAYWKSKLFTFDADELKKMVDKVFFSLKVGKASSADLYYITNKKYSNLIKNVEINGFMDFRFLDFNNFTFNTSAFPKEAAARIKAKKITHFQILFKNDRLNEGMGISSAAIKYRYMSYIK
ncbi:hypothetical protein Pony_15 [Bacillus phage Pony]|uniref:Uncharacterized protein n=1 Tax=Bacillus phage Pony TaxID=1406789 RepID=U5PWV9_9CAUD|nr:virion structural protein [Bacillus phage Pony]AGY48256.1 hypothetical protein Pony_15 [Bacillus phage Pony]